MAYNPQQSFGYNGGTYGTQVQPVNLPNPSAALQSQIPGLPNINNQLSSLISGELSGNISPQTLQMLKNTSATNGVTTGMPGSGLNIENLLSNEGLTSNAIQQEGVGNYNSTIPTISGTQTLNPALELAGNTQNAVSAASPNPTDAANEEQTLLQQYMAELNPAGGRSATFTPSSNPYSQFPAAGGNQDYMYASNQPTTAMGGGSGSTYNPYQEFSFGGDGSSPYQWNFGQGN